MFTVFDAFVLLLRGLTPKVNTSCLLDFMRQIVAGRPKDILSALKGRASKLQQQLDTVNAAIKVLGGKNSAARHRKRRVSASARAKMSRA